MLCEQRPDFLAEIRQLRSRFGICFWTHSWMRWRSAAASVGEAGEIVSLAAGETEGFAATTAAAAADAGEIAGEGFGDPGVGDASSQFTKPDVGEELFSRFALGFPKVWS